MSLEIAAGQHALAKTITKRFVAFLVGFVILLTAAVWAMHTFGAPARAASMPTITNIDYSYDVDGNPTELRITGTDFGVGATAQARWNLGNYTYFYYPLDIVESTDTFIKATVPDYLPYAPFDLRIETSDGGEAIATNAIVKTKPTPHIDSVVELSDVDGIMRLQVTGTKLRDGVTIGGCALVDGTYQTCYDATIISRTDTVMEIEVDTTGLVDGAYSVTANLDGQYYVYENAFVLAHPPLEITAAIQPDDSFVITIDGELIDNIDYITVGGQRADVTALSAASLTATLPAENVLSHEIYDLVFVKASGYEYTYPAAVKLMGRIPTVTAVEQIPLDTDEVNVGLVGTDFPTNMTATVNGEPVNYFYQAFTMTSDYVIIGAEGAAFAAGTYDIVLTDQFNRSVTVPDAFVVPVKQPVITDTTYQRTWYGTLQVRLEGTNLYGATITFEGQDIEVSESDDAHLIFDLPGTTPAGDYDITVGRAHASTITPITVDDIYAVTISEVSIYIFDGRPLLNVYGSNYDETTVFKLGDFVITPEAMDDDYIEAYVSDDVPAGYYDVTATRPDGQTATYADVRVERPAITDVTFESFDDKVVATISGERFIDERDVFEEAKTQSPVVFGGQALPLCVTDTPLTMQDFIDDGFAPELVSESAPCYRFYDADFENIFTNYQVILMLPADYDVDDAGTVSVNGIGPFTFNESQAQPQMTISTISPGSVYSLATRYISFAGTNLTGATVTIDGKNAVVAASSDTMITAFIPESTVVGPVDVVVTGKAGDESTNAGQVVTILNGVTYLATPPKTITGVAFSEVAGRKYLTVTGTNLVGALDGTVSPPEYLHVYTRSLVKLGDVALPMCTEGTGVNAAYFTNQGVPSALVSDIPSCYVFVNNQGIAITTTKAIIMLADNFNIAAPSSVSVNSSPAFSFNTPIIAPSTPAGPVIPEAPVAPGVPVIQPAKTPSIEVPVPTAASEPTETATVTLTSGGLEITEKPTLSKLPTFSGIAPAFSKVVVTVHSDPVICETTADATGHWTCTLDKELPTGNHTVAIAVVDPQGNETKVGPYDFAVANMDTTDTADEATPVAIAEASKAAFPWAWVIAGAAALILIVVAAVMTRRKKTA